MAFRSILTSADTASLVYCMFVSSGIVIDLKNHFNAFLLNIVHFTTVHKKSFIKATNMTVNE